MEMHILRVILRFILTTDLSIKEICYYVGNVSPFTVYQLKQILAQRKCDWQKIRVLSDADLLNLMYEKCPTLARQLFPNKNFIPLKDRMIKMPLKEIWDEYRQASYH